MDHFELPPPYDDLSPKEAIEHLEIKKWMRGWMPKFKGSSNQDPNVDIDEFSWALALTGIENEDTIIILLALSIVCQAKYWYDSLPHDIAPKYEYFEDVFFKRWGGTPHEEWIAYRYPSEAKLHDERNNFEKSLGKGVGNASGSPLMSEENPPPVTCDKTLEMGVGESFGNLGPHDEPNDFENMC